MDDFILAEWLANWDENCCLIIVNRDHSFVIFVGNWITKGKLTEGNYSFRGICCRDTVVYADLEKLPAWITDQIYSITTTKNSKILPRGE